MSCHDAGMTTTKKTRAALGLQAWLRWSACCTARAGCFKVPSLHSAATLPQFHIPTASLRPFGSCDIVRRQEYFWCDDLTGVVRRVDLIGAHGEISRRLELISLLGRSAMPRGDRKPQIMRLNLAGVAVVPGLAQSFD